VVHGTVPQQCARNTRPARSGILYRPARHSTSDAGCKGPTSFDCDHGDLLYVYQDAPRQSLKAIYFDNEGQSSAQRFNSRCDDRDLPFGWPREPGPQFRLTYELKNAVISGEFQMRIPGQTEWRAYLEWSGSKRTER
jgi:hypothetical protein